MDHVCRWPTRTDDLKTSRATIVGVEVAVVMIEGAAVMSDTKAEGIGIVVIAERDETTIAIEEAETEIMNVADREVEVGATIAIDVTIMTEGETTDVDTMIVETEGMGRKIV